MRSKSLWILTWNRCSRCSKRPTRRYRTKKWARRGARNQQPGRKTRQRRWATCSAVSSEGETRSRLLV
ncbi:unnamed protein product [Ectocarpus sp. 13 AM-2016]